MCYCAQLWFVVLIHNIPTRSSCVTGRHQHTLNQTGEAGSSHTNNLWTTDGLQSPVFYLNKTVQVKNIKSILMFHSKVSDARDDYFMFRLQLVQVPPSITFGTVTIRTIWLKQPQRRVKSTNPTVCCLTCWRCINNFTRGRISAEQNQFLFVLMWEQVESERLEWQREEAFTGLQCLNKSQQ